MPPRHTHAGPPRLGDRRCLPRYVMDHPGCVHGGPQRHRYGDGFRVFILDLCATHPELDLAAFAAAALVPLGTLKDWLRGGREAVENPEPVNLAEVPGDKAKGPRIESILAAYPTWKGDFPSFCNHVQLQLRIPWGRTTISGILHAHGLRKQKRRRGRRPDEKATLGGFETFFAGAQWSADGSPLSSHSADPSRGRPNFGGVVKMAGSMPRIWRERSAGPVRLQTWRWGYRALDLQQEEASRRAYRQALAALPPRGGPLEALRRG